MKRITKNFISNFKFCFKGEGGQSIVEALVVIAIISAGAIGIMGMLSYSLGINREVANQYIAVYLASEGIEVLRNIMDDNFKDESAANWNKSLEVCSIQAGQVCGDLTNPNPKKGCAVNYNDEEITPADANANPGKNNPAERNPLIFQDPYYVVKGGGPPPSGQALFSRIVCVRENIGGDSNILEVEAIIKWTGRGNSNHTYSLVDRFYNVPTKF